MALLNTDMNLFYYLALRPLNPPILGGFKIYFSPIIGGWGAHHILNQQRLIFGRILHIAPTAITALE